MLRELLIDALQGTDLEDIARRMGYNRKRVPKAVQRIESTCNDRDLGLSQGHYDFRFTATEFLVRLCQVLEIEDSLVKSSIYDLERQIQARSAAYPCWIFVETGFRRTSEPILMLALCESLRNLQVPHDMRSLPLEEQVSRASEIVKKHYNENHGELKFWGKIRQYHYHYAYAPDGIICFDPDGTVLSPGDYVAPAGHAQLKLHGRNLWPFFKLHINP